MRDDWRLAMFSGDQAVTVKRPKPWGCPDSQKAMRLQGPLFLVFVRSQAEDHDDCSHVMTDTRHALYVHA